MKSAGNANARNSKIGKKKIKVQSQKLASSQKASEKPCNKLNTKSGSRKANECPNKEYERIKNEKEALEQKNARLSKENTDLLRLFDRCYENLYRINQSNDDIYRNCTKIFRDAVQALQWILGCDKANKDYSSYLRQLRLIMSEAWLFAPECPSGKQSVRPSFTDIKTRVDCEEKLDESVRERDDRPWPLLFVRSLTAALLKGGCIEDVKQALNVSGIAFLFFDSAEIQNNPALKSHFIKGDASAPIPGLFFRNVDGSYMHIQGCAGHYIADSY